MCQDGQLRNEKIRTMCWSVERRTADQLSARWPRLFNPFSKFVEWDKWDRKWKVRPHRHVVHISNQLWWHSIYLSFTRTHTHSHTHTLSLSITHTHRDTRTHTHSLSLTHKQIQTQCLSFLFSLLRFSLSLSFTLSLSLSLELSPFCSLIFQRYFSFPFSENFLYFSFSPRH